MDDEQNRETGGEAMASDNPEPEEEFSLQDLSRVYAETVGLEVAAADDHSDAEPPDPRRDAAADNSPCPISPKSILEAALFIGSPDSNKLTTRKIAQLMRDVSEKELNGLIKELNQEYESLGHAFRIYTEGRDVQLRLIDELEPIRQKFYGEVRQVKLSQAAIDVLSLVAYRQPITREEIDTLRARPCGSVLRQLVQRGLLEKKEKPQDKRRTQYQTTPRFLELFEIASLEELPRAETESEPS